MVQGRVRESCSWRAMVVDDFEVVRVLFVPAEADALLVVDADAVLAATVALQRFKAVTGRQMQDLKPVGGGELEEFPTGRALDFRWETTRRISVEDRFRVGVGKAFYHGYSAGRNGALLDDEQAHLRAAEEA